MEPLDLTPAPIEAMIKRIADLSNDQIITEWFEALPSFGPDQSYTGEELQARMNAAGVLIGELRARARHDKASTEIRLAILRKVHVMEQETGWTAGMIRTNLQNQRQKSGLLVPR